MSGQTNYIPEPLDKDDLKEPSVVSYVPDESIRRLLCPFENVINDFHRAISFVKKAKIYTFEDLVNKTVIFGGSKATCKCKGKLYPFQDSCYVTSNIRGEKVVAGLERREVEIVVPTISLLPYLYPNLMLRFGKRD